ncbi:MAG: hypothetical protein J1E80_06105 [Desulfovibrionaceae bacterium]|nr:hypothetical protein [Desulfovibrionaceae bacterium]
MSDCKFSVDELFEIIEFLAKENNSSPEEFIHEIKKKINKHYIEVSKPSQYTQRHINPQFSLEKLSKLEMSELSKTKPSAIIINKNKIEVNSWTDATINFVKILIINGDIKQEDLPFYLDDKQKTIYIDSIDNKQLNGKDGGFREVDEGFYVNIRYNAKYHILNIMKVLKNLSISEKYEIRIVISHFPS